MTEPQRARLRIFQSALTYRDDRLAGLDAAVLMEVVEHVDPPRLAAFERTVFGHAAPATVIVTTPNVEYDVIGDIHGCRAELELLLAELGYSIDRDEEGRPAGAHRDGRRAIFVGDLVDRGPDSPGVLRLVMGMVAAGDAFCVPGNHENKPQLARRPRSDG